MKCPKCRHVNPEDTLFCEECNHRVDQPYRLERETTVLPPLYAAIIAVVLGAFAAAMGLMRYEWLAAVIPGAFGIVLGSYSLRIARTAGGDQRNILLVLSGAAVVLSVTGFILGMTLYNA